MKKLVLLLSLILISTNAAFASGNYYNRCPQPQNQQKASSAARFLSNASGSTFIAEQIGQSVIKKELKKATGADFNVDLKAFSASDLLNGTFKSLNITGKNVIIDGNYISSINAQTLYDYNSVNYKSNPMKFNQNMGLNVSLELTDSDLKNTLIHGGVLDGLNKINLSGFGITFFKIDNSTIEIKDGKLYFTINASAFGIPRPFDVVVCADIKIENGKIVTSKIDLINLFTVFNLGDYTYLLNKLDPLTYTVDLLGNPKTELNIQKFQIVGDRIFLNGIVFFPKN